MILYITDELGAYFFNETILSRKFKLKEEESYFFNKIILSIKVKILSKDNQKNQKAIN